MPRWRRRLIGMLVLAVAIAAGYFPVLKRNLRLSAQAPAKSEEQVRRELTQPAAANAGEPATRTSARALMTIVLMQILLSQTENHEIEARFRYSYESMNACVMLARQGSSELGRRSH